ncbi:hypothetical protein EW093_09335 [Thiospirochaeta perfilievii]|uniref:Uncharacterized protein n=1 Tax=Thiospirochaeta perfilievii TaxID=252967 RepID=A0A5C1QCV9_9SPIO|nr:hypothetical protein [Thiospirochaeta perfilievii]QEN04900.1 hypothetical protein EW093_09335 [Thiospirochaeta perfilievii]
MNKLLIYFILIIHLLSCGGSKDISTKYTGDYVAIDSHNRELFYGVNILKNRVFKLWYLEKTGEIEERSIILRELNIENKFRYNFSTERFPTWTYTYFDKKSPIKVIFSEFRNGEVKISLRIESNSEFKNRLDLFQQESIIIPVDQKWSRPMLLNFEDTDFYNTNDKRFLKFNTVSNKYYSFSGYVENQYYTKNDLFYTGYDTISDLEGVGKYSWTETNIINTTLKNIKIELETEITRGDKRPNKYSYNIKDKIEFNGKVESYSYEDKERKVLLIKVKKSEGEIDD